MFVYLDILDMAETRINAEIRKIDPEQRRFWGWAYISKRADGTQVVDHSGDTISTPEARASFEKAWYGYVRDSGAGDDMHDLRSASRLIEAVHFDKAKAEAMGIPEGSVPEGVWVGFEAEQTPAGDQLWERVKNGDRSMISIYGRGVYA